MSLFVKENFSRMKFNVREIPEGKDILKEIPLTVLIKSWDECESKNRNKIIRYICYMYDKESPYISSFPDIEKRHSHALAEAGIKTESKLGSRLMEAINEPDDIADDGSIISVGATKYGDMIFDFLVDQHNMVWTMIVSNIKTFYEYQRALIAQIQLLDDKDKLNALNIKSKLMEESDAIVERIDSYSRKIFGDKMGEQFASRIMSPESHAK